MTDMTLEAWPLPTSRRCCSISRLTLLGVAACQVSGNYV